MSKVERVILPTNVKPQLYNIHLTPSFDTFIFTGTSQIHLEILETTPTITLNALDIEVQHAHLLVGEEKSVASVSYDVEKESVIFTFDKSLPVGKATLDIQFTGVLNDKLCGFYRSKWSNGNESGYLAATQFEAVDARRAFPCWDEPAVKASFIITLTVPVEMTALSNMPPASETLDGENKTIVFQETPIVSTYLIAFAVGKFECVQGVTSNGVEFRVWTTPGKKEMGHFALDVGVKVLTYFEEFYGIKYPLVKQDMIAIPDFAAGAMENWGLITYRETALLCELETASVSAKSRIAYVVAHELAHQWFGNLVTMQWWKELWLNEGFATFVGNQAVNHFFPEWDIWTQFISQYIFRALDADSLKTSHPIEVDVAVAREIDEIFDTISYCKGASVIRMIENYLGEENFRKGLHLYLDTHKYSNAVTEDLWKALSETSGVDVPSIMDKWTKKIGYPVVTVEETETPNKFKITQQRFLSNGDVQPEDDETIWTINLGYLHPGIDKVQYVNFSEKSGFVEINGYDGKGWIKFNAEQSGFYRVKYSPELSRKLGEAIKTLSISAGDRLGIVNDTFALAKAGILPLTEVFALINNFENEDDYSVWSDLSSNIGYISNLISTEPYKPLLQKFVLRLFGNIYNKLGTEPKEGEKDLHKLLRSVVLSNMGSNGSEEVLAWARSKFEVHLKDPNSLSPDLAGVVFKLVSVNGHEQEYDSLVKIYETETKPDIKIKALACLCMTREPELIKRSLVYGFSDKVRTQDIMYVYSSTSSSPVGRELTWTHVKENWEDLQKKLSGMLLGRVITYSASSFTEEKYYQDVETYFSTRMTPGIERTVQQTLESIRGNITFLNRERESFSAWLEKNAN